MVHIFEKRLQNVYVVSYLQSYRTYKIPLSTSIIKSNLTFFMGMLNPFLFETHGKNVGVPTQLKNVRMEKHMKDIINHECLSNI